MRNILMVGLCLVLVACTRPPAEAKRFDLGPNTDLDAGSAEVITIELSHPLSQKAVRDSIEAPGTVELVSPTKLRVALGPANRTEERVVVRAGALDPSGLRLASDWRVVVRRMVSSGFDWHTTPEASSLGPFVSVGEVRWIDNDTLFARLTEKMGSDLSTIKASDHTVTSLLRLQSDNVTYSALVLGGRGFLYSNNSGVWLKHMEGGLRQVAQSPLTPPQMSPDGSKLVSYPKTGAGHLINLNSGEDRQLAAPAFSGSSQFDSWSPDGTYYLAQGRREDEVPGFYLFDGNGQLASTFVDSDYLSLYARWSTNSREIAFLSIPSDQRYQTAPGGWTEPMFAPRLGILDLTTDKAVHYHEDGMVFYGLPLWSSDGKSLAVTLGVPWQDQGVTNLRDGQVHVLDTKTGQMQPIMPSAARGERLQPLAWAPGGHDIMAVSLRTGVDGEEYWIYGADGGKPVSLPGQAWWVTDELLAVKQPTSKGLSLVLMNRAGETVKTLTSDLSPGSSPAVSPDRTHLAFVRRNDAGQVAGEYLTIVSLHTANPAH